ncbi:hypothetical protein ACHAWF_014306 [Thalassiosira exigua]
MVEVMLMVAPDMILWADSFGRLPNSPTSELVKLLAGKTSESAKWPAENEILPIHYAYGASMNVLTELIGAWEESMKKTDAKGRTPLHFAMGNADPENSPRVM